MRLDARAIVDLVDQPEGEELAEKLSRRISEAQRRFERRVAVVALSGGVDSSTVLAIAARSISSENTRALFLPDQDTDRESGEFARLAATATHAPLEEREITPILEAAGCYRLLTEICREIVPSYSPKTHHMRTEFVIDLDDAEDLPSYDLVIVADEEEVARQSIGVTLGQQLLAAMNLKQRVRMLMTYQAAERVGGFVLNTSNLQEVRQGFFVKHGDGAGDVHVLSDVYKTQVRRIANALELPSRIVERPATTDTFSASQSQETFFFGMPERAADLTIASLVLDSTADALAEAIGGVSEQYARHAMTLVRRRTERSKYLRATMSFE